MNVEFTNMVMIYDEKNDRVVVENRRKSWCGISFPGGHVEEGESFYLSAVREVKEETGLDIYNLKNCGVIHWVNENTFDRYIVYLYKTTDFSGELIEGTDEGEVFWTDRSKLTELPLSENFEVYLPMFFEDKYSEAYGRWNDDINYPMEYR